MSKSLHSLNKNVSAKLQAQPYLLSLTSAVKELCQNSIDSNATIVSIVYDPSQGDILCKDNGWGLRHEDMDKLGTQNHLTSKIMKLDDLMKLKTYGFKGVALYSMIQLAKQVYMASKCPGYNSTWVTSLTNDKEKSRILSEEWLPNISLPQEFLLKPWNLTEQGTVVIVHDLLFHAPVRRQMMLEEPMFKQVHQLKSDLFQLLIKHSNVDVTIDYLHKGKLKNIITYKSTAQLSNLQPHFYVNLVRGIFNPIIPNNVMKRVALQFKQFKLNGIMSIFPLKSKDLQFIFINGWKYYDSNFNRIVNSCFIFSGWPNNTTYQTMGKTVRWYPFFVFDIQSPPQTIDELLQDPEKIINKPHLENVVQNLILKVVTSFLKLQGYHVGTTTTTAIPSIKNNSGVQSLPPSPKRISISPEPINIQQKKHKVTSTGNDTFVLTQRVTEMMNKTKKTVTLPLSYSDSHINMNNKCWLDVKRINEDELNKLNYTITKTHLSDGEIISQIDKKFILTKFVDNYTITLLILDQHACDERVKLESYLQNYINDIINKTLLLKQVTKPCEIQLNEIEMELFAHYEKEFDTWGVGYLLNTNPTTLKITTLSEIMFEKCHGNTSLLREVMIQHIEDLKTFKKSPIKKRFNSLANIQPWHKFINNIPGFLMNFFSSKACRSAVMFGDPLTPLECELLVHNLTECYLPFQCAHGRPSITPLTVINQSPSIDTPIDYLLE
ncbi:DNA mismatch repair protein Mlh3p [Monosporozyma unispora]|nr:DNA mismatch repair protein [Kazachstania unispora]